MFQVTFRFALLLAAIALVLCGLTRVESYDTGPVRALLDAPGGCSVPCWSGIRPGVTRVDEAIIRLRANPWVGNVTPLGGLKADQASGAVSWTWNGKQPFAVDAAYGGALSVQYGIVTDITLPTRVTVADTWLTIGPATRSAITHASYPYARYDVDYLGYPERGLSLRIIIERPVTFARFWNSSVTYIYQPLSTAIGTPFRLPPLTR